MAAVDFVQSITYKPAPDIIIFGDEDGNELIGYIRDEEGNIVSTEHDNCVHKDCIIITPVSEAETTTKSAGTVDNSSKKLSVSTNTKGARYLVDANGNIVHLFGMARCQTHAIEEHYDHGGAVNTLARHYADLGMNYMRLAINVSGIVGDKITDPLKLKTDAEIDAYIERNIDPDVRAIINEGMYVGLDLHSISLGSVNPVDAQQTLKYLNTNHLPFLKRLALYYKDEPMIANIEIWNEPSIGVATGSNGVSWRQTLRNYYINSVSELRKIDNDVILMVSDDNAGWGMEYWLFLGRLY